MKSREIREKFGVAKRAVEATKVFIREMGFDHKHVETRTALVINENEGTYCHLNLYDGNLGRNVEPRHFHLKVDDEGEIDAKWLARKTAKMDELDRDSYPDVIVGVGESQVVEATV